MIAAASPNADASFKKRVRRTRVAHPSGQFYSKNIFLYSSAGLGKSMGIAVECSHDRHSVWSIADRKSQVRTCLGFCAADYKSLLAYESDKKHKYCLTWDFPSALVRSHTNDYSIYCTQVGRVIIVPYPCSSLCAKCMVQQSLCVHAKIVRYCWLYIHRVEYR